MAKPLRSQLNQIRAWVRQGRTDAWIAHQLEVSANELREFRRRHELEDETEDGAEVDLRDEIEAEIEAATREEELAAEESGEADSEDDDDSDSDSDSDDEESEDGDGEASDEKRPRRRRRRRGGRGGAKRSGAGMQATFDHGDEGYGLWLDPAVSDDPVYSEHWAGKRKVEVTIEPDRIVIRRAGADNGSGSGSGSDD
jgi:hypothetical protein